jgi:hypothetical protein
MKSEPKRTQSARDGSIDVDKSELLSRLSDLEDKVDKQQETIDEQQETIDEQQETIDEQSDRIEQLEEDRDRTAKQIAETKRDVHTVEKSVEAVSDDTTPAPNDGNTGIQQHELTPIEQISRADNIDEIADSPSVRRAVSLFKNISEWGSRTPKGIVVKSSDRPLELLSADRDESLCWKQYYRAAEALESLSEGAFTFVNSSKHGKMLVLHEHSDTYQRLVNGALSSSSAGATV